MGLGVSNKYGCLVHLESRVRAVFKVGLWLLYVGLGLLEAGLALLTGSFVVHSHLLGSAFRAVI